MLGRIINALANKSPKGFIASATILAIDNIN